MWGKRRIILWHEPTWWEDFPISQGTWGHHTIGIIANWVLFWIQKHWQGSAFCSITIHYWAYLPLSASSIWAEANFSSLWVPWRSPNCWVRASAWKHETDQRWTPDNFNFLSKCMYIVPLWLQILEGKRFRN